MQRRNPELDQNFEPNKKRRIDDNICSVFIQPEKLLVMSSTELEKRVDDISCLRPLTQSELKEVKRQMRLVKNREYAQSSRIKKKQQVEELQEENALLKERVQQLEDENRELKSLLNPNSSTMLNPFPTFQDFSISSCLFESEPSSSDDMCPLFSSDSPPLSLSSPLSCDLPYSPDFKNSLRLSGSFASTTFCMFLIMLSFGVFFSAIPGTFSTFPMANFNQQVIPFSVGDQSYFYRTSRVLLSHEEELDPIIRTKIVQPNITDPNSGQQSYYVRKDISYSEVLLDEANYTKVKI